MPGRAGRGRERRATIVEILREHEVRSQDELLRWLRKRGYRVTQPSISRDLHELQVAKVNGRYLPGETLANAQHVGPELRRLAGYIRSSAAAGPHLLILRTPPGIAPPVALALDGAGWPEVVGTIAGDDTIFVATPGRTQQARLEARLARAREEAVHA